MSLLGLIGTGVAAALINTAADQSGKKAYKNLDDKAFDDECSRYGVMYKNKESQILKVAARCRVKTDKNGILPRNGYYDCLDYVNKYSLSPDEEEKFISAWKQVIGFQEMRHRNKIITDNARDYRRVKADMLKNHMDLDAPEFVLTYEHWFDLRPEEYKERLERLYTETVLGDIAVEKPILRNTGRVYMPYHETWVLRGENNDDSEWIQKSILKATYSICCKELGWEK